MDRCPFDALAAGSGSPLTPMLLAHWDGSRHRSGFAKIMMERNKLSVTGIARTSRASDYSEGDMKKRNGVGFRGQRATIWQEIHSANRRRHEFAIRYANDSAGLPTICPSRREGGERIRTARLKTSGSADDLAARAQVEKRKAS
jgi:hypothetical protein